MSFESCRLASSRGGRFRSHGLRFPKPALYLLSYTPRRFQPINSELESSVHCGVNKLRQDRCSEDPLSMPQLYMFTGISARGFVNLLASILTSAPGHGIPTQPGALEFYGARKPGLLMAE